MPQDILSEAIPARTYTEGSALNLARAALFGVPLNKVTDIIELLRSYRGGRPNSLIGGSPLGWSWYSTLAAMATDHHGDMSGFGGTHHAHSQLSGVGPDDHHARDHHARHESGGADQISLDDLTGDPNLTRLRIGGTEVISSARVLHNVAYVDQELSMNSHKLIDLDTPTLDYDAVTKQYVDLSVLVIGINYYLLDAADAGVPAYKSLTITVPELTEDYLDVTQNTAGDYEIGGWIAPDTLDILKLGVYTTYLQAEKISGNIDVRLFYRLYERDSGGSETLIQESMISDQVDSRRDVLISLVLASDHILASGSRLVIKFYARYESAGASTTLRMYYQGDVRSRLVVPTTKEVLDTLYVPYTGAEYDVDLNAKNLTNVGNLGVSGYGDLGSLKIKGREITYYDYGVRNLVLPATYTGGTLAVAGIHNQLTAATKRFTVTASESPDSGSLSSMFDNQPRSQAEWEVATTTFPLTIEIDFGGVDDRLYAFVVSFIYGHRTAGVKIERYDGTAWSTIFETTTNNQDTVIYHCGGLSVGRTYRLRFTFSNPSVSSVSIAELQAYTCNPQIFGCKQGAFVDRLGDVVYGSLTMEGAFPRSDNAYDLGSSSYRWRDLCLSRDIYMGGTLQSGSVPAARVDSGVLDVARIPNLDASKITSGTFDLDRIPTPLTGKDADTVDGDHLSDIESTMDSKITTHAGNASAHHAKTTSISELTDHDKAAHDALNIDADTVDGQHRTDLESTMDSKIATHAGNASAHHAKTTSSEIDHGSVQGLGDDDHTQYLNTTRHDTTDRHSLGTVVPHDALANLTEREHSSLTGIGANDHHTAFTPSDHDARDHSVVASTISLSELGSRAHSQLTGIGASDHHAKTTDASEITSGTFAEARIPDHMSKSKLSWTADKLLKGAGAGNDPVEIDIPAAGIWTLYEAASLSSVTSKTFSSLPTHDMWRLLIRISIDANPNNIERNVRLRFNNISSNVYSFNYIDGNTIVLVTGQSYLYLGSVVDSSSLSENVFVADIIFAGQIGGTYSGNVPVVGVSLGGNPNYNRFVSGACNLYGSGSSVIQNIYIDITTITFSGYINLYYKDF